MGTEYMGPEYTRGDFYGWRRLPWKCAEPAFALWLPLELAPPMNSYANMRGYQRAKIRTAVDGYILQALSSREWPGALMGVRRKKSGKIIKVKGKPRVRISTEITGGRARAVHVLRATKERLDELSCDTAGGKIPIDRLVQHGILRGDSARWCRRSAAWQSAKLREGFMMVLVYELPEEREGVGDGRQGLDDT